MRRKMIAPAIGLALLLTAGAGTAGASGPAGQFADQSAGTSQSASSNAASTQVQPTNSNISVRIGSPGDNGSVSQSNSSSAAAAAGNAALTDQAVSQAGGGSGVQGAAQGASTDQSADANAQSTQIKPTNSNIDVRIGSPGDNGDVNQSNSSQAGALAGNIAKTGQSVEQQQGGDGCCHGAGVQAAEQGASTHQSADSNAESKQIHPTNENTSVRIDKPHKDGKDYGCGCKGDRNGKDGGYGSDAGYGQDVKGGHGGNVTQSNDSSALSFAGNIAKTDQSVEQTQSGCGCNGDRVQAVGQWADTKQHADANATSEQKGAENSNTPVRIHSYGNDGDVNQSNSSDAAAFAGNLAFTGQSVEQVQSGDRCGCKDGKGYGDGKSYDQPSYSNGVQAAGQWADTKQHADANADSTQIEPSNSSAPVRIGSWGDDGSVSQSNSSYAKAKSFNLAATLQSVSQIQ